MKKLFLFLSLTLACGVLHAKIYKAYVNPVVLKSDCGASTGEANIVCADFVTGFSESRHVLLTAGESKKNNSDLANSNYDYLITITMLSCKVEEKESVIDGISKLFSSSNGETKKYVEAEVRVGVYVYDLKNDRTYCDKTISSVSVKDEKDEARAEALTGFRLRGTQFVDNNFPIYAKIISAEEVNKKNEIKTVLIDQGTSSGVRKNLMFDILGKQDGKRVKLGKARVVNVRGAEESLLEVYGTKDGDKQLFSLYSNDLITSLQLRSRANEGATLFRTKERSSHYPTDHGRKVKPTVAMSETKSIGSNIGSGDVDNLAKGIQKGLSYYSTTTITPIKGQLSIAEAARQHVDALIKGDFRKIKRDTETNTWKDKKGNQHSTTYYIVSIEYGLSVYNVKAGSLIVKKDIKSEARSEKGYDEASETVFGYIGGDVSEFICNAFPVEGWIVSIDKMKKDKADMATIDIGSDIGVSENMKFDIYRQLKNGGPDSRELLGEATVKKVEKNTASVKIKGAKDAGKKIAEILQNANEEENIILISRYASPKLFSLPFSIFKKTDK